MEGKKMSPEMEKELAKAQGELIRQAMDYSAKQEAAAKPATKAEKLPTPAADDIENLRTAEEK